MTKRQLWRIALAILGFICLGTIIWFCIYGIPQPSPNKPMSRHDYQSVVKKNTHAPSKHEHYVSGQSFVHPVTIIYTNLMMMNKPPKKDEAYDRAAAIGSAQHYIDNTENRNEYHTYTTPPHITTVPVRFSINRNNVYVRTTEVNAVFIRKSQK